MIASLFTVNTYAYWGWLDVDIDGYAGKMQDIDASEIMLFLDQGWTVTLAKPLLDCDDHNRALHTNTKLWIDNDGDKYATGYALVCIGDVVPAGYVTLANRLGSTDCNDADASVWRHERIFKDTDGDKWTGAAGNIVCIGASAPAGFVAVGDVIGYNDCDDNNPAVTVCPPGPEADMMSFSIYPNPVTDRLNITPNENWNNRVEIKLVDQFGRLARTVNSRSASKGQVISVNTSDLNPGVYQLTITNGELTKTRSIGVKL